MEAPLASMVKSPSIQASTVASLVVVIAIPGVSITVIVTFTLQGGSFREFISATQNS